MSRWTYLAAVMTLAMSASAFAETLVSDSSTELEPKTRRHQFSVKKNQNIVYEFETEKKGPGSSFRIRLYQRLERGTYKAVGTVVLERTTKKGQVVVPMAAGAYRIDVASKRMHYRFSLKSGTGK